MAGFLASVMKLPTSFGIEKQNGLHLLSKQVLMKIMLAGMLMLIPLFFTGQVIIDDSDMPQAGDSIRLSHTVNLGSIDFEATGPDHSWDFTSLFPVYQTVDTFVAVNETPFLYQVFFFLTANLAQKQFEFDQFPGLQVTDSYRFYKNSGASFNEVGFGVSINGIPLPTLYDDPDMIYQFPVQPGSIDSSTSGYDFNIPGIAYIGGWKKRTNMVDGWGSLTTPFGTFETLRLKSEIVQYDSIHIDSLGFGFPVYQEFTEYKWLAKGYGLPVCELVDNGIVQSIAYIDSVRSIFTGDQVPAPVPLVQLYPNPATDQVTLRMECIGGQECMIGLFSVSGVKVFEEAIFVPRSPLSLDLSSYQMTPGAYVLVISTKTERFRSKLMIR
jgi:hypothetical protein